MRNKRNFFKGVGHVILLVKILSYIQSKDDESVLIKEP